MVRETSKDKKGGQIVLPPLAVYVLDILQAPVTTEEKRKTLLRAEIFAGLYFEKKIIEQIFREVETMLNIEESAGYQRIFKKGVEKGIQQGMEKGMEKGRQDNPQGKCVKAPAQKVQENTPPLCG